jgi:hypothetical protein
MDWGLLFDIIMGAATFLLALTLVILIIDKK